MLNIGGQKEREQTDVSKLSDAELISQLAEQAKELGIHIDLNYSFHKRDELVVQARQKSLNRNGDSSV
jgi:hypothetical protein